MEKWCSGLSLWLPCIHSPPFSALLLPWKLTFTDCVTWAPNCLGSPDAPSPFTPTPHHLAAGFSQLGGTNRRSDGEQRGGSISGTYQLSPGWARWLCCLPGHSSHQVAPPLRQQQCCSSLCPFRSRCGHSFSWARPWTLPIGSPNFTNPSKQGRH